MKAKLCFIILLGLPVQTSLAFNTPTHHQILRSALAYMKTHVSQNPLTEEWLRLSQKNKDVANENPLERFFVRSIIDTDYQDDLWLEAWYLKPISAGKTNVLGMLTSLYHFTNVTKPGEYWQYDGYAYKNTQGTGNDSYLGEMGLQISLDLSKPIQKYLANQSQLAMADVSMPPSYLLAIDAFDNAIMSPPSLSSFRKTWIKEITYAESYIINSWIYHQYAREEIEGLPSNLQELGVSMHLAQDLAMPHHAQGIAGICHSELETYIDTVSCDDEITIPGELYDSGIFDEVIIPNCQNLNSLKNVEKLVASNPVFDAHSDLALKDRLIGIAKITAEYRVLAASSFENEGLTISKNGKILFSDTCENVKNSLALKKIAQRQYEIATAATVMLIELAAKEYKQRSSHYAFAEEQCKDTKLPPPKAEMLALSNASTRQWVEAR